MSSLPLDQAVDLVKDAFVSAGERDIYTVGPCHLYIMLFYCGRWPTTVQVAPWATHPTSDQEIYVPMQGDAVEIYIITKEGTRREVVELKKD